MLDALGKFFQIEAQSLLDVWGGGGINGIIRNSTGFDLSVLSLRQWDHQTKSSHWWQHGKGSAGPP